MDCVATTDSVTQANNIRDEMRMPKKIRTIVYFASVLCPGVFVLQKGDYRGVAFVRCASVWL